MIIVKHKTAIKIMQRTITDSTDRESNMCILISIFYFRIFAHGVTHGDKDARSFKDFIWCKSRDLEGRVSPRFSCVTPAGERISSDLYK